MRSLKFFRGIIALDGFGLDDDGGVAFLVVLALVRDGPDNIARSEDYRGHNDGHN